MPRREIHFVRDSFYHVFNRGSEKRTIFQSGRDYLKFRERAKENAIKFKVDILCYCLMPNHFHFLLKQCSDIPIAIFMNTIQLGHAKFFNTKYDRVGPLFQGRFKAKVIDTDEYLLQISAYIHRNPVAHSIDSGNLMDSRNRIRERLRTYRYSSYREYLGLEKVKISNSDTILSYFSKTNPRLSYEAFVEGFDPDYETFVPLLADI